MLYNINYEVEIDKPIEERRYKGVNYLSTSLQDISRDAFLNACYSSPREDDYIIDMRGGLFNRENRNTVVIGKLTKALYDAVTSNRGIEPMIRQFAAMNLDMMDCSDLIKLIKDILSVVDVDPKRASDCIGTVLGLLIPFKKSLFKTTHKIVFYVGVLIRDYAVLLHILSYFGFDIVYVNNFVKDSEYRYSWIRKPTVDYKVQEDSVHMQDTLAYTAQQEIRTILDDSLIRRENKVSEDIDVSPIKVALPEVKILYNEGLKFRPNFSKSENKITVPSIIGVFQGVCSDFKEYIDYIIEFSKNEQFTTFFSIKGRRRGTFHTSINTRACEMLISKDDITCEKLTQLSLSSIPSIKEPIRSKILEVVNATVREIPKRSAKLAYLTAVLELPQRVVDCYNNFLLTEANPKLIGFLFYEDMFDMYELHLLKLLANTGWDVLIFTPESTKCFPDWDLPVYNLGNVRPLSIREKGTPFEIKKFLSVKRYPAKLMDTFKNTSDVHTLEEIQGV